MKSYRCLQRALQLSNLLATVRSPNSALCQTKYRGSCPPDWKQSVRDNDCIFERSSKKSRAEGMSKIAIGIAPLSMNHDERTTNCIVFNIQRIGTVD
jgi:hypothetical protein